MVDLMEGDVLVRQCARICLGYCADAPECGNLVHKGNGEGVHGVLALRRVASLSLCVVSVCGER
jgi:hypothetical protein